MSKFCFSLLGNKLEKVIRDNESSFSVSGSFQNEKFSCAVFQKINLVSHNIVEDDEGFAYMVGTYMFKGKTGKQVIHYVYDNFSPSRIIEYKKKIVGMWSILVYKNGSVYFFNDYYGLYDLFYNDKGDVANAIADVVTTEDTINEYGFIMDVFQQGAFPGETSYKQIKKIKQNEYLRFDDSLSVLNVEGEYSYRYVFSSEESALNELRSLLKEYAGQISSAFGKPTIFLTGGLDSRLVLGSFLIANVPFECAYGRGYQTCDDDLKIVQSITERYNIETTILDWRKEELDLEGNMKELFDRIGFYNYTDSSSLLRFKTFADCSNRTPFYSFGYFCEAIRLREWAEKKDAVFSLVDYVDNYYINKSLKRVYENYADYRQYLIEKYQEMLKQLGYNGNLERIPLDIFENFRWMMARYCDSRFDFVLNNYGFAFSLLSVPQIHELILSLPAELIRNGRFQVKLIYKLDPELVTCFDLFSHRRKFKINKNFDKVRKLTAKNMADTLLNSSFLKEILKKILQSYQKKANKSSETDRALKLICEKYEQAIPDYVNWRLYDRTLNNLAAFLIANQLAKSQNNMRRFSCA